MMLGRTMPTAVFPRCRSSIVSPSAFENVYVFWCVPIHSGVFFVISSCTPALVSAAPHGA
eukprot:2796978-Rhodomonas_salina.1